MRTEKNQKLTMIGSTEYVEIAGIANVPAKIDTGADTSSVWASNIDMREDGVLVFSLFDKKSPFYTGEKIETRDYIAKSVRSSHGDTQIRYRVKLPIQIKDLKMNSTFTLADRTRNSFPILIGRKTLKGKFIIDVTKSEVLREKPRKSHSLNEELKQNPYEFHQKYIEKGDKS